MEVEVEMAKKTSLEMKKTNNKEIATPSDSNWSKKMSFLKICHVETLFFFVVPV